jgi:hypothetical protein
MCHIWSILVEWRRNLDSSESRLKTLEKLRNVVLEKDGDDKLDRSC